MDIVIKIARLVQKNSCITSEFIEQESRAVAGNPRDAAVIFDP